LNKVEYGILFTLLYFDFASNDEYEDCGFVDFALDLSTVGNWFDLTGQGQAVKALQGCTQTTTPDGDYVLKIKYEEFTKLYLKWKRDSSFKTFNQN